MANYHLHEKGRLSRPSETQLSGLSPVTALRQAEYDVARYEQYFHHMTNLRQVLGVGGRGGGLVIRRATFINRQQLSVAKPETQQIPIKPTV